MSATPPWVDLATEMPGFYYTTGARTPDSGHSLDETSPITGKIFSNPLGGDLDYLRMLKEAQKEVSRRSSTRVSPISSNHPSMSWNTPAASPPNTPINQTMDCMEELRGVFINADPDNICTPKQWKLAIKSRGKADKEKVWSGKIWMSALLTNLLSFVIGAGIGIWVSRRWTTSGRGWKMLL